MKVRILLLNQEINIFKSGQFVSQHITLEKNSFLLVHHTVNAVDPSNKRAAGSFN